MTYEQQALWNFQEQTSGALDSPARTSVSQESKKACKKVNEADCFTKLCDCLPDCGKKIDPSGFSVKMLRIYLALETDLTSRGCCLKWGGYGYSCEWQVLNSKDFGVPQYRERVFLVCNIGEGSRRKIFPIIPTSGENTCQLRQVNNPRHSTNRVYEAENGLAKTIKGTCGGAERKLDSTL